MPRIPLCTFEFVRGTFRTRTISELDQIFLIGCCTTWWMLLLLDSLACGNVRRDKLVMPTAKRWWTPLCYSAVCMTTALLLGAHESPRFGLAMTPLALYAYFCACRTVMLKPPPCSHPPPVLPGARHCNKCGQCSFRYSHHCGVLRVCIARHNRRVFIQFLVTLSIFLVCTMVRCAHRVPSSISAAFAGMGTPYEQKERLCFLYVFFAVAFCAVAISALCMLHVFLVIAGRAPPDIRPYLRDEPRGRFRNDEPCYQNCADVLGTGCQPIVPCDLDNVNYAILPTKQADEQLPDC